MNNLLNVIGHSFIILPLIVLIVQNLMQGKSARKICRQMCAILMGIQIVSAAAAIVIVMLSNSINEFRFGLFSNTADYLRFDFISLVFLLCIALAGLASTLVSFTTETIRKMRFCNLFIMLILGMNGIVLVNDLFSMYVFLEVIGVASFVLIAIPRGEKQLEGAFKYLILSSVASIFVLAGLTIIFFEAGSLNFDVLKEFDMSMLNPRHNLITIIGILMAVAGFAVKAGVAPFHGWLPDAHQASSCAVSIMLAGSVIKAAGIYGITRLVGNIFTNIPLIDGILTVLGLVSILFGAFAAYKQTNFKRMIAYSSVSQMGYILIGICAGSPLGVIGAVLHALNHTAFKSTLFVNASAIDTQTGTLDMNLMGGLHSRMPVTGTTNVLAFLSMAGIPPLSGFWSKLLIIMAVWQHTSPLFAGIALFASILTGVYFMRMQSKVFFGDIKPGMENVVEAPKNVQAAEIILTVITVGLGIAFPFILQALTVAGLL